MKMTWQKLGWAFLGLAVITAPVHAEDTPQEKSDKPATKDTGSKSTKTYSFSFSGDEKIDSEAIIDQVKKSLKAANLSEEVRDKILNGVQQAIDAKKGAAAKVAEVHLKHLRAKDGEKAKTGDGQQQVEVELKSIPGAGTFISDGNQVFHFNMSDPGVAGIAKKALEDRYVIGVALKVDENQSLEKKDDVEKEEHHTVIAIEDVFEDSPAAKAGLEEGDILIAINGKKIEAVEQLTDIVQVAGKKDKVIEVRVRRGDETLDKELKPTKKSIANTIQPNVIMKNWGAKGGGFVLPEGSPAWFARSGTINQDVVQLKEELEQIQGDLSEIKAMLKAMKDGSKDSLKDK